MNDGWLINMVINVALSCFIYIFTSLIDGGWLIGWGMLRDEKLPNQTDFIGGFTKSKMGFSKINGKVSPNVKLFGKWFSIGRFPKKSYQYIQSLENGWFCQFGKVSPFSLRVMVRIDGFWCLWKTDCLKLENERLEQWVSCQIRSFPIATLRDETVSESSAHFELYLQFSYSPRRVGVLTFCTVVLLVVDYTEKGTFTPQVSWTLDSIMHQLMTIDCVITIFTASVLW